MPKRHVAFLDARGDGRGYHETVIDEAGEFAAFPARPSHRRKPQAPGGLHALQDIRGIAAGADRDGDVDLDDRNAVFANLGKEFDGCNGECPGGCGGGGGGGGPPGDGEIGSESLTTEPTCDRTMADAIEMLGFDNPGQFAIWFGGLTAEEQDLVITSLDAWINCER